MVPPIFNQIKVTAQAYPLLTVTSSSETITWLPWRCGRFHYLVEISRRQASHVSSYNEWIIQNVYVALSFKQPVPLLLMYPHTISQPPPCLTVFCMQLSLSSSPTDRFTYTRIPLLFRMLILTHRWKSTPDHYSAIQLLCFFSNFQGCCFWRGFSLVLFN